MEFTRIASALNELGWRSSAAERSRVVFACRRTQLLYRAACDGHGTRLRVKVRPAMFRTIKKETQ